MVGKKTLEIFTTKSGIKYSYMSPPDINVEEKFLPRCTRTRTTLSQFRSGSPQKLSGTHRWDNTWHLSRLWKHTPRCPPSFQLLSETYQPHSWKSLDQTQRCGHLPWPNNRRRRWRWWLDDYDAITTTFSLLKRYVPSYSGKLLSQLLSAALLMSRPPSFPVTIDVFDRCYFRYVRKQYPKPSHNSITTPLWQKSLFPYKWKYRHVIFNL